MTGPTGQPFLPLLGTFGDPAMAEQFGREALTAGWLTVERALATAQADLGQLSPEAARAIASEATIDAVAADRVWTRTRTVGYPILPLIEEVAEGAAPVVGERIHLGATTQDIMDTGFAIRMAAALDLLDHRVVALGDAAASLASRHRSTVMAGRTHGQQAVPTTFGAKVAVWLAELGRHRDRIAAVRTRVAVVSLFGAGGTSAALGPSAPAIRRRLADELGLAVADIPWHAARDGVAEAGFVAAACAATCGKIALEVAELSRTEIGEVREGWEPGRGASSTMPQKANPIDSEVVIGLATMAAQQVAGLLLAMRVGQERAIGEWHVEWDGVPTVFCQAASALARTTGILAGLEVFPDRMARNLSLDGGLIMAEAVMMAVADLVGRTTAHHLISDVCASTRASGRSFAETLRDALPDDLLAALPPLESLLDPSTYLGEAVRTVDLAVDAWRTAIPGATDGSGGAVAAPRPA